MPMLCFGGLEVALFSIFSFLFCLFVCFLVGSSCPYFLRSCFVAVYSLSGLFLLPVICFCSTTSVLFFYFFFLSCFYWCLVAVRPQFSVFLFLVAVCCLVVILFWAFLLLFVGYRVFLSSGPI